MSGLRLSPRQKEVVEHTQGSLLVVAGPGSGKTRVLTERIRRLLTSESGHFRILALTFTNKAANEMAERLEDLGALRSRMFIGTLHGFCLEMLADRGKPLGLSGPPQIFEHLADRRQILYEAAALDPLLSEKLRNAGEPKAQNQLIGRWLQAIGRIKAHPESLDPAELDLFTQHVYEAYNGGLRATGAFDFDDLLLLGYRLLTEYPKIAGFYRRLYRFICIDEAQDLNEAQYCVLRALCGNEYKNVMMVGDPKQSIFGFNTSSPHYMQQFQEEFDAKQVELTENFRSSQAVLKAAQKLQSSYELQGQLPIKGKVQLIIGDNEEEEALLIVDSIEELMVDGHKDIEGDVTPERIAVLGRTRYALLHVESAFRARDIPFYKRLSSAHEFESDEVKEFLLGLRLVANPRDKFHFRTLSNHWGIQQAMWRELADGKAASELIEELATKTQDHRCQAVAQAISSVGKEPRGLDLSAAVSIVREYADTLSKEETRRAIHEDAEILIKEWDEYLRSSSQSNRSISAFMSSMALGATQNPSKGGVALLTVHSSKGMEFDVVFVVGMAEGVFPDFRARGDSHATAEERRNAFVAVTRSRRLLYMSFPRSRKMPWGDIWKNQPSKFLQTIGLIG